MSRSVVVLAVLLAHLGCSRQDRPSPHAPQPSEPAASRELSTANAPPAASSAVTDAATPVSAPAPRVPVRRPGAFANLDPSDDLVVGPPDAVPDCEAQLAAAGVVFHAAELPIHARSKLTCGAPQVVTYVRGPGQIAFEPTPLLTCSMALALASFERILQAEAERIFHSPVVRVAQLGTYSCREIAAYQGVVSEHSYANAIDLARFRLKNGTLISVLHDFDRAEGEPQKPAGAWLRAISQRGFDEDVFSNVLTPFWDAHHKDHLHLDLGRYRVNGVRPQAPE
jgi:hypothetical protein